MVLPNCGLFLDSISWNVATFTRIVSFIEPIFSEWPVYKRKLGMDKTFMQHVTDFNVTDGKSMYDFRLYIATNP